MEFVRVLRSSSRNRSEFLSQSVGVPSGVHQSPSESCRNYYRSQSEFLSESVGISINVRRRPVGVKLNQSPTEPIGLSESNRNPTEFVGVHRNPSDFCRCPTESFRSYRSCSTVSIGVLWESCQSPPESVGVMSMSVGILSESIGVHGVRQCPVGVHQSLSVFCQSSF